MCVEEFDEGCCNITSGVYLEGDNTYLGINRYCFHCKKELNFNEIVKANMDKTESMIEKLWLNERVEFYCCSCYREEKELEEERRKRCKYNIGIDWFLRILCNNPIFCKPFRYSPVPRRVDKCNNKCKYYQNNNS